MELIRHNKILNGIGKEINCGGPGWNNGSLYYSVSLVTIIADNNSDNNWGRFWLDSLKPP